MSLEKLKAELQRAVTIDDYREVFESEIDYVAKLEAVLEAAEKFAEAYSFQEDGRAEYGRLMKAIGAAKEGDR